MRHLPALAIALSLAAIASACAGAGAGANGDDPPAATEDHLTTAVERIPARDWASCWTEPDGAKIALVCVAAPVPAKYPYVVSEIDVSAANADGDERDATLVGAGGNVRPQAKVGSFAETDFPLALTFTVSPMDGDGALSSETNDLVLKTTLASPAAATAASPLVLRQPFDIWPLAFQEKPRTYDDVFLVTLPDYAAPLGAFRIPTSFKPEEDTVHLVDAVNQFADRAGLSTLYVPAPAAGKIDARLVVNMNTTTLIAERDVTVPLTGPGVYVVTAAGIRPATDADGVKLPPGFPVSFAPATSAAAPADAGAD